MEWHKLSATSHYQTAVAVQQKLLEGNIQEATTGIRELIQALGRSEKRALKSQLIRLMMHIIKWKTEPERRSRSWIASIYNARDEIREIQEETPSLTDEVIKDIWENAFQAAKREAEGEMNQKSFVVRLSWQDVFEAAYELDSISL